MCSLILLDVLDRKSTVGILITIGTGIIIASAFSLIHSMELEKMRVDVIKDIQQLVLEFDRPQTIGIDIQGGSNNKVFRNNINGADIGVRVTDSPYTEVFENNITINERAQLKEIFVELENTLTENPDDSSAIKTTLSKLSEAFGHIKFFVKLAENVTNAFL